MIGLFVSLLNILAEVAALFFAAVKIARFSPVSLYTVNQKDQFWTWVGKHSPPLQRRKKRSM